MAIEKLDLLTNENSWRSFEIARGMMPFCQIRQLKIKLTLVCFFSSFDCSERNSTKTFQTDIQEKSLDDNA
jgi:hypothetical protein